MAAVPGSSPVACPFVPGAVLMVATDAGEEVHETDVVRFCVLPSAKVPMATKATSVCAGMLAVCGVTCIDVKGEPSTSTAQSALSAPSCAVTVAFPGDRAVTTPPPVTLATPGADDVQVTAAVMTWVLPSLNVPVATAFMDVVGASTAVDGVTEIEVSVTELTFSGALPVTPLKVAEMLAVPGPIAVAVLPAMMVATAGLSEAQVQSLVMSCVVSSLNLPVAPKVSLVPGWIVRPEGVTEMDTIVAFETCNVVEPLIEPTVAAMVVLPGVRALARPPLIVATAVLDELQEACAVTL